MSGKLVGEVLKNAPEDLTPAQMLVLVSLAESARDRDRCARFDSSVVKISDRTRLKSGTVRNALAELVGRGLLIPLNGRVQRGTVQHYRLPEYHEHHRHTTTTDDEEATA